VTFAPNPYADPAGNESPGARRFTEPLRELSVFALLAGNAVFLLIGVTRLFVVIDRWASDFGLRCSEVFPTFVGPYAIGLPILAVLLATHVEPMVPRTRLALLVAVAEYGVSAFFGALTFLGAFAYDLRSPRAVIEAVLIRGVWLGFLLLGGMVLYRMWRGLFPAPPPRSPVYGGHAPTTYGKPYPGQPMFPQPGAPTSPTGHGQPGTTPAGDQSAAAAWPEVPPPPMPAPITIEADPTTRLTPVAVEPTTPAHPATPAHPTVPISTEPAEATTQLPTQPQPPDTGGDATQVVPLPSGEQSEPPTPEADARARDE
jgi:hypothetical protein